MGYCKLIYWNGSKNKEKLWDCEVFSGALIPLGILYAGYLSSYIGTDITYIINNLAIIIIVCLVFKNIERDC